MRRFIVWIAVGAAVGAAIGAIVPFVRPGEAVVIRRTVFLTSNVTFEDDDLFRAMLRSKWELTENVDEVLAIARSPKLSVERRSIMTRDVVAFVSTGNWGATHANALIMSVQPVVYLEEPPTNDDAPDALRRWVESSDAPFAGRKLQSALKIARGIDHDGIRADALALISAVHRSMGDDEAANRTLDEAIEAAVQSSRTPWLTWTMILGGLGVVVAGIGFAMLNEFGRSAAESLVKRGVIQQIIQDAKKP